MHDRLYASTVMCFKHNKIIMLPATVRWTVICKMAVILCNPIVVDFESKGSVGQASILTRYYYCKSAGLLKFFVLVYRKATKL